MSDKILSVESAGKLRKSANDMIASVEEVIKVTHKEQHDKIKELAEKVEKLEDEARTREKIFDIYKETYSSENSFICQSIEDERKLEALKKNWEYVSFEDIDKLCKF